METPAAPFSARAPAPDRSLSARVRAQYEALPYPAYGLFLPLRGQEAYASNSLFAARLLEQGGAVPALRAPVPKVLLAGCGDVFPYLAGFWEPRRHRLIAMDLSARSLRRARLRCLPRMRPMDWLRGDLEDEGLPLPSGLAHIDCYGVLHHLARPAAALARLGRALAPGGTARIMVYNAAARSWLRHLQRAFALLGLDGLDAGDRQEGRALLDALAAASPALRDRLAPMRGDLENPARLVDAFFHAREARLSLDYWLGAIAGAGLRVIGWYDRYGELDDLPNPLLAPPGAADLAARIADRRFENNLELYLARIPDGTAGTRGRADSPARLPSTHALRAPPRSWFGYRETCALPWGLRSAAWRHFLANVSGRPSRADAWAARMPPRAFQRLGRLGAVLPGECGSGELQDLLRSPLEASMEPPDLPAPVDLRKDPALRARIEGMLRGKPRGRERAELAMARLDAAQRP